MSISAGLVGLPNVGKSTLFNALTKSSVPAENYPFCTIDPHVACTVVPDGRLEKLREIYNSEKIIPSTVQFVDIAGLVKGAASGEGLGNQFLGNIREVNLIIHVLRCFDDANILSTRTESVDPLSDFDVISTELILKDIESISKRKEKFAHLLKASKNDVKKTKELNLEAELLDNISKALDNFDLNAVHQLINSSDVETIPLLCAKKFLVVANLSENDIQDNAYENNIHYQNLVKRFGKDIVIPISAKLEYDLSVLNEDDRKEMEALFGMQKSGLDEIISRTYQNLGLITFFTCGPREIHAWPITSGMTVRKASGEIHSDLERGFIFADVFNVQDLFALGSIPKLKDMGKIRTEGQDYQVKDGDIILVKFNV